MKKLFVEKTIEIHAPVEKVWKVLTDPEFTGQWVEEGWGKITGESMIISSEWKPGSEVLWKNRSGELLVKGNVTSLNPYKLLRFTILDTRSTEKFPVTEEDGITYEFGEQNRNTRLKIRHGDFSVMKDGDMFYHKTAEVWDKVLPKVKELAEADSHTMEQPTCGKGLARNSVIPARFGELIAAMARNLELHMGTLDLTDKNGKLEYDAYQRLVNTHKDIASRLMDAAGEMYSYYDLPMASHDEKKLSDPKIETAFRKFLGLQNELIGLLQKKVEQGQQVLDSRKQAEPVANHT